MEHTDLETELRSVKRRRIEIRSAKAALDMEDLNLDDKQSTIEQLLNTRSNITPARSIECNGLQLGNGIRRRTVTNSRLPARADSRQKGQSHGGVVVRIKNESAQPVSASNVITIEDEDDGEIVLSGNATLDQMPEIKSEQGVSKLQKDIYSTSSPVIRNSDSSSPIQSKIVVLKVRFPSMAQPVNVPVQNSKTSIKSLLSRQKPDTFAKIQSIPEAQAASLGSLESQLEQLSADLQRAITPRRPLRQVISSPRNPVNTRKPLASSADTNSNIKSKTRTSSISTTSTTNKEHHIRYPETPTSPFSPRHQPQPQTEDQECPCKGRNRNCHTCRGTPAVIAEGQTHLSLSRPPSFSSYASSTSPSGHRSSNTRVLGQRPTSRPKSYRIDEFEDMDDFERSELEIRFCRRVVGALVSMSENQDHTRWIDRLRERGEVWDVFIGELKRLLQRKRIPREDENGDWNGAVLVTRCRDRDEFVVAVDDLLAKITGNHPRGCCVCGLPGAPVECWSIGFGAWFELQMRHCVDCIAACDVALNLVEREDIVDDWEVK